MGWIGYLTWYLAFGGDGQNWGFIVIDLLLAVQFWRMSRGRLFPVPLFFAYSLQIVLAFMTTVFGTSPFWAAAVANRVFEVSLAYIILASIHRINLRLRKAKRDSDAARRAGSQMRSDSGAAPSSQASSNSLAHRFCSRFLHAPR